ncbi:DnaD domain-containing protein [Tannockella kyphosi]|uniref:DnaD domain-containing protein n=1 Tax=Tannockella kyphosi TaxID=2899121 RepID=UPI0020126F29|nr:DnaD domain protein [Tannockella kyphosi]
MIKYISDIKCIDYSKLLMMRAKQLDIQSDECLVLLYLLELNDSGIRSITPVVLAKYVTYTTKQLDAILRSLMVKKLIVNKGGTIELLNLNQLLLSQEKEVEEVKEDLISIFESEFGRSLSPFELTSIREWLMEEKFEEETVLLALKEAVKSNAVSLRYIEAILQNWKKNGISRRFVDQPEKSMAPVSNYDWINK